MKFSFQGLNNKNDIAEMEQFLGGEFKSEEIYRSKANGHKFKIGDFLELYGLEDYPQFDGEMVVITAIREDGIHGKAYYFQSNNEDLMDQLNWTYEYRLRNLNA